MYFAKRWCHRAPESEPKPEPKLNDTRIHVQCIHSGDRYTAEFIWKVWDGRAIWKPVKDLYDPSVATLDEAKTQIDKFLKDATTGSDYIKYP